ncbi:RluA family pseudouridine synthase [Nocardia callitridis]|uniref:RNA pseudouridylate synthase n=1 Tax=Nocardia callitridis TaxID=648753 RepID=A0ABP9KUR4_9NOCA
MDPLPTDIDWSRLRASTVIDEDAAILTLNKPSGISVTGERHDTDIVELAAVAGEQLYPVHRIDKVTSGLVLMAKDLAAHGPLTRQFNKQTAEKTYLAIVAATGMPETGVIDLPLSVGRKNRVRVAAPRERIREQDGRWFVEQADLLDSKCYPSTTHFATVQRGERHTVLALRPVTGRRHQIRVHLAWTGHPILGDPLFDKSAALPRTYLHSWRLRVEAPWRTPQTLFLEATPDSGFWEPEPLRDSALPDHAAELLPPAGR